MSDQPVATPELNQVVNEDCVRWLSRQPEPFADLIFADPPFNIGYKYDVYEDRKAYDEYHAWTAQWVAACKRVLKPTGSFWIAIGDDYAAEVRMIGREAGLHLRNWVIWHYTFGQQTKRKFARSHTHLFYFVNDPACFTFHDKAVRVFSDRQRRYNDRRANLDGKLPDDTWAEFPRLCGTFAERLGWHPCQMPETVLGRIIRACSNAGDVVFDPFSGSGTTLATAKRLSRSFVGTELSPEYAASIRQRLDQTVPMAQLEDGREGPWPSPHVQELLCLYAEEVVSLDSLREDAALLKGFTQHLNWRLEHSGCANRYSPGQVWEQLEHLRSRNRLGMIRTYVRETTSTRVRPLEGLFARD